MWMGHKYAGVTSNAAIHLPQTWLYCCHLTLNDNHDRCTNECETKREKSHKEKKRTLWQPQAISCPQIVLFPESDIVYEDISNCYTIISLFLVTGLVQTTKRASHISVADKWPHLHPIITALKWTGMNYTFIRECQVSSSFAVSVCVCVCGLVCVGKAGNIPSLLLALKYVAVTQN